jgi:hypothetical protein
VRRLLLVVLLGLAAAGCGGSSDPQAGASCATVYRSVALETAQLRTYATQLSSAAPGSDAWQRAKNLHDASDRLVAALIDKNAACFRDRR